MKEMGLINLQTFDSAEKMLHLCIWKGFLKVRVLEMWHIPFSAE